MDLKDAVLSTLAELDDFEDKFERATKAQEPIERYFVEPKQVVQEIVIETPIQPKVGEVNMQKFLVTLRERVLVLFEGLQSINNSKGGEMLNVEKKLDLTINFLEFMLASIEEKLEVTPD